MWISIEKIGTFKKEGSKIRTLVTLVTNEKVEVLSSLNYTKNRSIFLLENTATFSPEDIAVVTEMENLSNVSVLKELATNGHVVFTEITDKKKLAYIQKCIVGNTDINLDDVKF